MAMSRRNPPIATDRAPQSGGREKQKGRTRGALLAAAARLLAAGQTPTVGDVADAADVSRRTAYRYFATQEQLLTEAVLEGLRPDIERDIEGGADGDVGAASDDTVEVRLDRAVKTVQRSAVKNEALLRTMIRLTVGPFDSAEADVPAPPLRRGYRRIEWIELALAPAKKNLGKRRYDRLVAALTVCMGIDSLIVLRDLCGLSEEKAEAVVGWAAQALLRASLDEIEG
jgi:AcrR family transcriptional regulator